MKQFLTKSFALTLIALGCIFTSCEKTTKTEVLDPQPGVKVTLIEPMGTNDVTAQFVANDQAAYYAYAIGTDTAIDKELFLSGTLPGYTTFAGKEPKTVKFEDLEQGVRYVIYAIAFDANDAKGPLSVTSVYTAEHNFVVTKQYVGDNSAGFDIRCSDDYSSYIYCLGKPDDREAFINGELEGIKRRSETFIYTENFFGIQPDTDFVFYAMGFDRHGDETDLIEIPIRTAALNSDEIPNATVTYGEADFYAQNYTITPNAKCKKVVFYQKRQVDFNDVIENKNNWASNYMEMFDAWQGYTPDKITEMTTTFSATDKILEARPFLVEFELGVAVDLYVLVYDENYKPAHVKHIPRTLPAKNPALAIPLASEFDCKLNNFSAETQTIDFSVKYTGDNLTGYFFEIIDKAWYDAQQPTAPHFLHNYLFQGRLYAGGFVYHKKDFSTAYSDKGIKPDKDYFIAICPMNANGPNAAGWGELVTIPFSTKANN